MSAEPIPLKSLVSTPLANSSPNLPELAFENIPNHSQLHFTSSNNNDPESSSNYTLALPPVDTGKDAWSFLVAATILETLIWGIPYVVGIFHEFWIAEMFRGEGKGTVTLAATLQTGLMYMSVAVFGP